MTDTDHYVWRDPFAEIEYIREDAYYEIEREREYCHESIRRAYSAMSHENAAYRAQFDGMMQKATEVVSMAAPTPIFMRAEDFKK